MRLLRHNYGTNNIWKITGPGPGTFWVRTKKGGTNEFLPNTRLRREALRCASGHGVGSDLGRRAGAQAQQTAAGTVEQVLVTGSLIRGAAAVGVPVTALSTAGLQGDRRGHHRRHVPKRSRDRHAADAKRRGRQLQCGTRPGDQIHGLDSTAAVRDLLLVDGMRLPPQGHSGKEIDPSIVPSIASSASTCWPTAPRRPTARTRSPAWSTSS